MQDGVRFGEDLPLLGPDDDRFQIDPKRRREELLRGPALQGRDGDVALGVDPEEEIDEPIAESAHTIEENYGSLTHSVSPSVGYRFGSLHLAPFEGYALSPKWGPGDS